MRQGKEQGRESVDTEAIHRTLTSSDLQTRLFFANENKVRGIQTT